MMHRLKMKLTQNKHAKLSADIKTRKRKNNNKLSAKNNRSTKFDKQPKHVEFSSVFTNNKPLQLAFKNKRAS